MIFFVFVDNKSNIGGPYKQGTFLKYTFPIFPCPPTWFVIYPSKLFFTFVIFLTSPPLIILSFSPCVLACGLWLLCFFFFFDFFLSHTACLFFIWSVLHLFFRCVLTLSCSVVLHLVLFFFILFIYFFHLLCWICS